MRPKREKNMKKASLFINLLILFAVGCGISTVFGGEDSSAKPVWQTLGGNFQRTGLSENTGPETGCIKWQFETDDLLTMIDNWIAIESIFDIGPMFESTTEL
jgi:hypothetical protein